MHLPRRPPFTCEQCDVFFFRATLEAVIDRDQLVCSARTRDGRVSMAALNKNNLEYFGENVSKAVKGDL